MEDIITLLDSITESQEIISLETGVLLIETIEKTSKKKLLKVQFDETVFEVTLKKGTYICCLDKNSKLKRVFRLKETKKELFNSIMEDWNKYSEHGNKCLTGGVPFKLITALGKLDADFYESQLCTEKTTAIKKILVDLGHELELKVYANKLSKKDSSRLQGRFSEHEWLFDLIWYSETAPFIMDNLHLAVECEWRSNWKRDKTNDPFSGIKYDFQKLIVCNAKLRLMIFKIKDETDLRSLDEYFNKAIKDYICLPSDSKFLFVAFLMKQEDFYYREISS